MLSFSRVFDFFVEKCPGSKVKGEQLESINFFQAAAAVDDFRQFFPASTASVMGLRYQGWCKNAEKLKPADERADAWNVALKFLV